MNLSTIKSPGVYIDEIDSFGNGFVPVPTSIPAFVGYTEQAGYEGKSYANTPTKISTMTEYEAVFGGAPTTTFSISEAANSASDFSIKGKEYVLNAESGNYLLYNQLQLFYANGGGDCYIVSVGDYTAEIQEKDLTNGIETLKNVEDVTLLLCPDANLLPKENFGNIAQALLAQSETTKNRFTILDVYNGYQGLDTDVISDFRTLLGTNALSYGAAYYPFLQSTVVSTHQISYTQITNQNILEDLLATETGATPLENLKNQMNDEDVNSYLHTASKVFKTISNAIGNKLNVQPPSGAMAGIYTTVDNMVGVWKAPANESLRSVTKPVVSIKDAEQENLNIDVTNGKSINAIRSFTGLGTLVWGARTLDGNSNDWRYISVRRLLIYIEQSIKLAVRSYVFSPNDTNTWHSITAMCTSFLTDLWKQGGLMGATPGAAFFVHCGLGSTMTGQDIEDGRVIIDVGVSPVHPAEFIIITVQQMQQTG